MKDNKKHIRTNIFEKKGIVYDNKKQDPKWAE